MFATFPKGFLDRTIRFSLVLGLLDDLAVVDVPLSIIFCSSIAFKVRLIQFGLAERGAFATARAGAMETSTDESVIRLMKDFLEVNIGRGEGSKIYCFSNLLTSTSQPRYVSQQLIVSY